MRIFRISLSSLGNPWVATILIMVGCITAIGLIIPRYLDSRFVREKDHIYPEDRKRFERMVHSTDALYLSPDRKSLRELQIVDPNNEPMETLYQLTGCLKEELIPMETFQGLSTTLENSFRDTMEHALPSSSIVVPLALGVRRKAFHTNDDIHDYIVANDTDESDSLIRYYPLYGNIVTEPFMNMVNKLSTPSVHINNYTCELLIYYNTENMKDARYVGGALFDADSLYLLADSFRSYRIEGDTKLVGCFVDLFHPAKLLWVVDIAYNPYPDVIDIPIEYGAEADFGSHFIRCVSEDLGDFEEYRYPIYAFSGFETIKTSNALNCSIVIGITPADNTRCFTAQFIDSKGNGLGTERTIRDKLVLALASKNQADRATNIRIRRYERIQRFQLPLGELPGTPSINDDVDNLFDIIVPEYYLEMSGFGFEERIAKCSETTITLECGCRGSDALTDYMLFGEGYQLQSGSLRQRYKRMNLIRDDYYDFVIKYDSSANSLKWRCYQPLHIRLYDKITGRSSKDRCIPWRDGK